MDKLEKYFLHREETEKALNRYKDFADKSSWYVGGPYGKLQLYDLAKTAFDRTTSPSVAFSAFHSMYETVRLWPGVQRGGGGTLAPSDEVYRSLTDEGSVLLREPSIHLANFIIHSSASDGVESILPSLKFIKRSQSYPWMPVSKILHFVNPTLFPIWDWGVVWNQVMWGGSSAGDAPFCKEYQAFCADNNLLAKENGARFLCNYCAWGARYIQLGGSPFMDWFADWIGHNFPDDVVKYNVDQHIATLYATAFEFVAIGAAYLEAGR